MTAKKAAKKPVQKKFQPQTKYQGYDLDGDGVITDSELAMATAMKEEESALRKSRTQRNMALWTLVAMGLFTLAMFFISKDRVTVLSDISNLFYLSGAGIVGAYMGMSAWMSKK